MDIKFYKTFCRSCRKTMLFSPTGKIARTTKGRVGWWYDCPCGHSIVLIQTDNKIEEVQ